MNNLPSEFGEAEFPSPSFDGGTLGYDRGHGIGRVRQVERSLYTANLPGGNDASYVEYLEAQVRPEPTGVVAAFINTAARWQLTKHDQYQLLGLARHPRIAEDILSGMARPQSDDTTDRMSYLFGISFGLGLLFNDDVGEELSWLRSPLEVLGGLAPLSFMLSGPMDRVIAVSQLVTRLRGLE